MKTKIFRKQLELNKRTIYHLTDQELKNLEGGSKITWPSGGAALSCEGPCAINDTFYCG
jgi:hypothetical protein